MRARDDHGHHPRQLLVLDGGTAAHDTDHDPLGCATPKIDDAQVAMIAIFATPS